MFVINIRSSDWVLHHHRFTIYCFATNSLLHYNNNKIYKHTHSIEMTWHTLFDFRLWSTVDYHFSFYVYYVALAFISLFKLQTAFVVSALQKFFFLRSISATKFSMQKKEMNTRKKRSFMKITINVFLFDRHNKIGTIPSFFYHDSIDFRFYLLALCWIFVAIYSLLHFSFA